jgi:hypothetical protein
MKRTIDRIKRKFPQLNMVSASAFCSSYERGIWVKNTESAIINGKRLMNGFCEINEDLDDYLDMLGLFAEPYDSGTLLIFEKE